MNIFFGPSIKAGCLTLLDAIYPNRLSNNSLEMDIDNGCYGLRYGVEIMRGNRLDLVFKQSPSLIYIAKLVIILPES